MKRNCAIILVFMCTSVHATIISNQTAKLLSGTGAEDYFGYSLATDGNLALIGALGDDSNGAMSGCAYLFDLATREQLRKILPSDGDAEDRFGFSVALRGNLALIGAMMDEDNGYRSGSAYLFNVATGEQLHKLLPDDGAAYGAFGWSVAVNEKLALVAGGNAIYLFDVATGSQLHKWEGIGGYSHSFMIGKTVSLCGNLALIGNAYYEENGICSGCAFLFDVTTYEQVYKFLPFDKEDGDSFGSSVALSGNLALIGAFRDGATGSAYLFDITTGEQLHKLVPPAHNATSETYSFGASVALRGGLALVGALDSKENGASGFGNAYVFDVATGERIFKLLGNDIEASNYFGASVALIRENALVGRAGNHTMGVYLFKLPDAPDADSDELPDWWEEHYFGVATNANPGTTCSNGVNTYMEAYIAGLDPNDPDSLFSASMSSNSVVYWQPSIDGRVYSTYWTTNLPDGFVALETNLSWTSGSYTDVIHSAESSGFYKVEVSLP